MSSNGQRAAQPDDPQRPLYHFTAPEGWLNDPNGLIQWGEQTHLFYQHNPHGAFHGTIHWGHAISEDLLHWRDLPIALTPEPASPDADGCWSGVTVDDNGVPTIIYSGNSPRGQRACLATSTDGLQTWQKFPGNPVIADPPPHLDLIEYRDHCVWREANGWRMIMGSGLRNVGGCALLYRSHDLRHWEYLHPLCVGDLAQTSLWTGSMWECPDFFALGERHVLTVAVWDRNRLYYSAAMSGYYDGASFVPQQRNKLDHGGNTFYAPQSFRDQQGRRIVFGWLQESCSATAQRERGWSGVMSLPRELRLLADGRVYAAPIAELSTLRQQHQRLAARELAADEIVVLDDVRGDALELIAELQTSSNGSIGLIVRRAADASEATRIYYDAQTQQLVLDRSDSSLDDSNERTAHSAPLALGSNETLHLHIFLDRSVIEVFANEQVALSSRIYPTRADSLGVAAFAEQQNGALIRLDAWNIAAIW